MMSDKSRKIAAIIVKGSMKEGEESPSYSKKDNNDMPKCDDHKMALYSAVSKFAKAIEFNDIKMATEAFMEALEIAQNKPESDDEESNPNKEY